MSVKLEMLNFVNGQSNRKEAGSTLRQYRSSNAHLSSSNTMGSATKNSKSPNHRSEKSSILQGKEYVARNSDDTDHKASMNAKARLDRVLAKLRQLAPIPDDESDDIDIQAEEIIKIWREELDEMQSRENELRALRLKKQKASFSPGLDVSESNSSSPELVNAYRLLLQERLSLSSDHLDPEIGKSISLQTVPVTPLAEAKVIGSKRTISFAESPAKPCRCYMMEQELTELRKEIKTLKSSLQQQNHAGDKAGIVAETDHNFIPPPSKTQVSSIMPEQIDESTLSSPKTKKSLKRTDESNPSSPINKRGSMKALPELIGLIEEQIKPQIPAPYAEADSNAKKIPLLYSKISLLETDLAAARIRCHELDNQIASMINMATFALEKTESVLVNTIKPIKNILWEKVVVEQELQRYEDQEKRQVETQLRISEAGNRLIKCSKSSQTEYELEDVLVELKSAQQSGQEQGEVSDHISDRLPSTDLDGARFAKETSLEVLELAALPDGILDVLPPESAFLDEVTSDSESDPRQPHGISAISGNYARKRAGSVVLAMRVLNSQYTNSTGGNPAYALQPTGQNPSSEQKEQVLKLLHRIDELTKERDIAVNQMQSHHNVSSIELVHLMKCVVSQVSEVMDAMILENNCNAERSHAVRCSNGKELGMAMPAKEIAPDMSADACVDVDLNRKNLPSELHQVFINAENQAVIRQEKSVELLCQENSVGHMGKQSLPVKEAENSSNPKGLRADRDDGQPTARPENQVLCELCRLPQRSPVNKNLKCIMADAESQTDLKISHVQQQTDFDTCIMCDTQNQTEFYVLPVEEIHDPNIDGHNQINSSSGNIELYDIIQSSSHALSKPGVQVPNKSDSPSVESTGIQTEETKNANRSVVESIGIQTEDIRNVISSVDAGQQTDNYAQDAAHHNQIQSNSVKMTSNTHLNDEVLSLDQKIVATMHAIEALDFAVFSGYDESACNDLQHAVQRLQQVMNEKASMIYMLSSQPRIQGDACAFTDPDITNEEAGYTNMKVALPHDFIVPGPITCLDSKSYSCKLESEGQEQTITMAERKAEVKRKSEIKNIVMTLSDDEIARRGASMLMKTNINYNMYGSDRHALDAQEYGQDSQIHVSSSRLDNGSASAMVVREESARHHESAASFLENDVRQLKKAEDQIKKMIEQRNSSEFEKQSHKSRTSLKTHSNLHGDVHGKKSSPIKSTVLSPMDQFNPAMSDTVFHIPKFPARTSKLPHQTYQTKSPLFQEHTGRFSKSKDVHGKSLKDRFEKQDVVNSSIDQLTSSKLVTASAENRQKLPMIDQAGKEGVISLHALGHKNGLDQMLKIKSNVLDFPNISGTSRVGLDRFPTGGSKQKVHQLQSDLYAIDEHASSWLE